MGIITLTVVVSTVDRAKTVQICLGPTKTFGSDRR